MYDTILDMNEEDRIITKVSNTKTYNQIQVDSILRPNNLQKLKLWLKYFVIIFVIVSFIYGSVKWGLVETFVVKGNSMLPAFEDKDLLKADKTFLAIASIKRGDIVVFRDGVDDYLVKRIIGLNYEQVEIKEKKVYIKNFQFPFGVELEEKYLGFDENDNIIPTCKIPDCTEIYDRVSLNQDEILVLGDNRTNSRDSRSFGPINKSKIVGVVRGVNSHQLSNIAYNIGN